MHSRQPIHSGRLTRPAMRRGGSGGPYRRPMRTELPAERLHRRLGARPDAVAPSEPDDDDSDADTEPDSVVPPPRRRRGGADRAAAPSSAATAASAVLATAFTLMREQPAPVMSAKLPPVDMAATASRGPSPGPSTRPNQPVVVSVVGLVHTPGLVTLAPGARIADALKAAGGSTDGADTIGLNMARQVDDGEQIVVGMAPVKGRPAVLGSSVSPGSAAPDPSSSTPRPAKGAPTALINLNTATVEQLDTLPGVGPVRAAAIVAWRNAHGKFTSVEQLGEVDGIGPGRLEKLRPLVRV